MTLEVVHRHEKPAPESAGVEFRPMAPISGAGFWSVCQRPYNVKVMVRFRVTGHG